MYDQTLSQIWLGSTLLIVLLCYFLVRFVVRNNKRIHQHTIEKERWLFELEKKELNMGFKERELALSEVSREVHDNIGQLANLIRMNLYDIEQLSANDQQLKLINYVSELTNRLIDDTRHISHSLNSDYIKERGLYRVLEYDIERINSTKRLKCFIDIVGGNNSLSAETQLLVYRICQEAIHNTLQHACADNLEIQLNYYKDSFKMVVRDDGVGFDEAVAKEKGMMGIGNMHQRAKLLNAQLDIQSAPGKGCSITLSC